MSILGRKKLYLPAVAVVAIVVALVVLHTVSTFRTLDLERQHWEDFLARKAGDLVFMMGLELDLEKPGPAGLKVFLDRMAQNPNIAYIVLVNSKGRRFSASRLRQIPELSLYADRPGPGSEEAAGHRRLLRLPDGRPVFEFTGDVALPGFRAAVIGLWMTPFEEARRQDERHALLMGAILLLLGAAAIYFMFVVQIITW